MAKIQEKWKNDELTFKRITNKDLTCKNCKYRLDDKEIFGNTSKCEKYPAMKPAIVLKKGECKVKETENESKTG